MLNRFKSAISVALVAVLLFTAFPIATFAEDTYNIKFSVTKLNLSRDELESFLGDLNEDLPTEADGVYPIPLIIRVGVSGSGKFVGGSFAVEYNGKKLKFGGAVSNSDSILDDDGNLAVSDEISIDNSDNKRVHVAFFTTDYYQLSSSSSSRDSITYLLFYVKRNPDSFDGKFHYYEAMNFVIRPEYVGFQKSDGGVEVLRPATFGSRVTASVQSNIIPDTPAPIDSLEFEVSIPVKYTVDPTKKNYTFSNELKSRSIRAYRRDGTSELLLRYESGRQSNSFKVEPVDLSTPGMKTLRVICIDGVTKREIVLRENIEVVAASGVTSISVTPPTNLYNTVGNALDTKGMRVRAKMSGSSGEVEVTSGYTITGYNKDKVGEQTITVTYNGKSASFKVYVCPIKGDADNNGKVQPADARVVLRVYAKLQSTNKAFEHSMDVDGNGKVNASDARKILRYCAKLDKTL